MKYFRCLFVALLCAIATPSFAQKTKATLTTEINTNWPDNMAGFITPSLLRATVLDIMNSIMPTAPVVSGNLACFNGTTGLLQDCSNTVSSITGTLSSPTWTSVATVFDPARFVINAFPIGTEFGNGAVGVVQGIVGAVAVPSTSIAFQSAGVAGYVSNASTTTNAVGIYGQGTLGANNTSAWGGNTLVTNGPLQNSTTNTGFNAVNLYGLEIDVNVIKTGGGNPTGNARGLYINSNSEAITSSVYAGISIAKTNLSWVDGIRCETAAASNSCLNIAAVAPGVSQQSQSVLFNATTSGNTNTQSSIFEDSFGNFIFTPGSGALISLNGSTKITGTLTLSPGLINANLAQMSPNTIKGNNTGSLANPSDLTPGQVGGMLCTPVRTVLITGTSLTYTPPTCNSVSPSWLEVDVQGGGGGGGGSGTGSTSGAGGGANASSFGALTANGGAGGAANSALTSAAGGSCSGSLGTQQNFPGMNGTSGANLAAQAQPGQPGGVSFYGGAGTGVQGAAGGAAQLNSGSGGAGGGATTTAGVFQGNSGAAGCHIKTVITSPLSATYTYSVAGTGSAGTAGTSGFLGGIGGAGLIDIIAHWQ